MFDIDKIFMSALAYDDKGRTTFEKGTKEYFINNLLDDYLVLLKDKEYATALLNGPIDDDTAMFDEILDDLYEGSENKPLRPYQYYTLGFQSAARLEFATGKFGIGPFALNLVNHILTMLYDVNFKDDGKSIMSKLGLTKLSRVTDKNGKSILSLISGLVNLHVDVAKDPKVRKLNINKYTYNLINLLIRTGLGKKTFYFTTQPVMKQLAAAYANATGKYMVELNLSSFRLQERAEHKVIVNMINAHLNKSFVVNEKIDQYEDAIKYYKDVVGLAKKLDMLDVIDELFNGNNTILHDISKNATNPNFELTTDKKHKVIGYSLSDFDVLMLVHFANEQFKPYATAMGKLVQYTKIDTKKQGKNIIEQSNYLDHYNEMFDESSTDPSRLLFEPDGLKRLVTMSYIADKTKKATGLMKEMLGHLLITATDSFSHAINRIINYLGINSSNKAKRILAKQIEAKIKSEYFFGAGGYCERNGIKPKDLLCGDNCIYSRLNTLIAKFASSEDYSKEDDLVDENGTPTNYVFQVLISGFKDSTDWKLWNKLKGTARSTYKGAKFINLANYLNDDSIDIDKFQEDWVKLLMDTKHPELQQFAKDLVVYAFITSADNGGNHDIFKHVPVEWRDGTVDSDYENSYGKYMFDQLLKWQDAIDIDDRFMDDIIQNTWYNDSIVPVKSLKGFTTWLTSATDGYPAILAGIEVTNTGVTTITREEYYPKYIKIPRKNNIFGAKSYTLYKLIGEGTHLSLRPILDNNGNPTYDKDGNLRTKSVTATYPIYVMVDTKGEKFKDNNVINEMSRNDADIVELESTRSTLEYKPLVELSKLFGVNATSFELLIEEASEVFEEVIGQDRIKLLPSLVGLSINDTEYKNFKSLVAVINGYTLNRMSLQGVVDEDTQSISYNEVDESRLELKRLYGNDNSNTQNVDDSQNNTLNDFDDSEFSDEAMNNCKGITK